tara:strand:+ start:402 stop:629 length:228 start_codon:yes stop_codon:yes gene_type:complete
MSILGKHGTKCAHTELDACKLDWILGIAVGNGVGVIVGTGVGVGIGVGVGVGVGAIGSTGNAPIIGTKYCGSHPL